MYKKRKKRVKVYFKYSLTVQSIISNAATRGEGEGGYGWGYVRSEKFARPSKNFSSTNWNITLPLTFDAVYQSRKEAIAWSQRYRLPLPSPTEHDTARSSSVHSIYIDINSPTGYCRRPIVALLNSSNFTERCTFQRSIHCLRLSSLLSLLSLLILYQLYKFFEPPLFYNVKPRTSIHSAPFDYRSILIIDRSCDHTLIDTTFFFFFFSPPRAKYR